MQDSRHKPSQQGDGDNDHSRPHPPRCRSGWPGSRRNKVATFRASSRVSVHLCAAFRAPEDSRIVCLGVIFWLVGVVGLLVVFEFTLGVECVLHLASLFIVLGWWVLHVGFQAPLPAAFREVPLPAREGVRRRPSGCAWLGWPGGRRPAHPGPLGRQSRGGALTPAGLRRRLAGWRRARERPRTGPTQGRGD